MDDLARGDGKDSVRSAQYAPGALTALGRGLRKTCPNCGQAPIYIGWATEMKTCSSCGLVYEPTEGDTWAFTIIGDRIPVAAGIIVVYFGLGSRLGPVSLFAVMALLVAALLWTAPNRWGLGVALLYLQRTWWPDPLDPIPPGR